MKTVTDRYIQDQILTGCMRYGTAAKQKIDF